MFGQIGDFLCVIGCFCLLIAFAILAIIFGKKEANKSQEILNRQAMKRNGTVKGGRFDFPSFSFPYQNLIVNLVFTTGGKGSSEGTHVRIKMPSLVGFFFSIERKVF